MAETTYQLPLTGEQIAARLTLLDGNENAVEVKSKKVIAGAATTSADSVLTLVTKGYVDEELAKTGANADLENAVTELTERVDELANNITPGIVYGNCSTAGATLEKKVTLANFTLKAGACVAIKFTFYVPENATLNINSLGAKPIYSRGYALGTGKIRTGDTATFVYDGNYYQLISVDATNSVNVYDISADTSNEGQFLRVVNGTATWTTVPNAEDSTF